MAIHALTPSLRRRLATEVADLGPHATDLHKANVTARCNALQRRLDSWIHVQQLYMPSVAALRASENLPREGVNNDIKPEKVKLWLPSELPAGTPCDPRLQRIEWELRHAQANDALNDVRRSIQLFAHLCMFKTANVRGQRANTRARAALDHAAKKKQRGKARYMISRERLQALALSLGKVGWDEQLRPLRDADMRYMTDMLDNQTEGTRDLSWIWKMPGVVGRNDDDLQESKSVHMLNLTSGLELS